MAAFSNFYFAPRPREPAVRGLRWRRLTTARAGLVARVRSAVAEIVVFLWATLALAFFGLIAGGFLFAR